VRLADVVATSTTVAATSSRTAKIAALAEVLRAAGPGEVGTVACWLAGEAPQGRIGVGWATLSSLPRVHAAEPRLTVTDLDHAVAEIARTTGPGSVEGRAVILGDLFTRATEPEAEFMVRLLGGELRQGALEGLLIEAVAAAAGLKATLVRRALMLGGDLATTATLALTEGAPGLEAVRLEVLRPVRPMLASTAESVAAALESFGTASVEWKLDGARIQVHRRGDEVRVFTRHLNDVTHRLPDVVTATLALPSDDLVLDGETLAMTTEDRPRTFQETMSRFGADEERAEVLHPFYFDVLRAGGVDVLDAPLTERLAVLERVAGPLRIPGVVTADADEAAAVLAEALGHGHEGVMVKGVDAPYEAGRRGKAWLKVKPVRTLDLVVLGAEWGHGRRQGWLSNLHLGARDPGGGPPIMVGKTFKGLTDELLRWQTEALLEREARREGITVFVHPVLVVEIALDGVQRSTRYPGGVALRFARVVRYRPDKDAGEADTIDEVRALLAG
jgi:DNA ligase-1